MIAPKVLFIVLILPFCSQQIFAQGLNFEFLKITNIRNGYTLQSNGSPQQLWIDPQNPEYLHAVFMNSQFDAPPYEDRKCIYFGSSDFGQSWSELGSVPDTSRSGFPAISGTTDGAAIIVNHSDYFSAPTRTGLFIDDSPFAYNFSAYDPGTQPPTSWPRCIRISNDKILIAATSQQSGGNIAFNTFDIPSGTFSGWTLGPVAGPEAFSLSVSNGGKIGFAYIADDITNAGDVLYSESTDNGITWLIPIKIFDCPAEQGIAIGAMRGICLNYYGEEPCIVFETCKRDFNLGGYYPRLPNQLLFWSPNINSAVPKVIADSSNVPFAPSLNPQDVFPPLCRPVIGRSDLGDILFIAFSAATENVYVGTDSISYFAGYFLYSKNGGNTWIDEPQKITPDLPLLDWKYISIAPVNPWLGDQLYVHLVLQADSLEAVPDPLLVLSAQYYHSMAWILSVGVDDDLLASKDFHLYQNYPNPFNPSTRIQYQVSSSSKVLLKVYDVLGNEVATLVNEEKATDSYDVEFNAAGLSSGIYFYTLEAANYFQTCKMILLK